MAAAAVRREDAFPAAASPAGAGGVGVVSGRLGRSASGRSPRPSPVSRPSGPRNRIRPRPRHQRAERRRWQRGGASGPSLTSRHRSERVTRSWAHRTPYETAPAAATCCGVSLTSSETAMPTISASPTAKRGGRVKRMNSAAIAIAKTSAACHDVVSRSIEMCRRSPSSSSSGIGPSPTLRVTWLEPPVAASSPTSASPTPTASARGERERARRQSAVREQDPERGEARRRGRRCRRRPLPPGSSRPSRSRAARSGSRCPAPSAPAAKSATVSRIDVVRFDEP